MRSVLLDFKINQVSYPLYGAIFGLFFNDKVALDWIYSQYIMLYGYEDNKYKSFFLDYRTCMSGSMNSPYFYMCPYLDYNRHSRISIDEKFSYVSDFLIEQINKGYYAYFFVDRKYISLFNFDINSNINNTIHELLIYGYDLDKQCFYFADFYKGKYKALEASFDEINKAYLGFRQYEYEKNIFFYMYNCIHLLKPIDVNKKKNIFTLEKNFYIEAFSQYLHIIPHFGIENNHLFGIQIYNLILENIEKLISEDINYVDLPRYYLFFEHKSILYSIITQLENKYKLPNISKDYLNIKKNAQILLNLLIKFNLSKDSNCLIDAKKVVWSTRAEEIQYLTNLCNMLNNIIN